MHALGRTGVPASSSMLGSRVGSRSTATQRRVLRTLRCASVRAAAGSDPAGSSSSSSSSKQPAATAATQEQQQRQQSYHAPEQPCCSRRAALLAAAAAAPAAALPLAAPQSAAALTVADVTPSVAPGAPLPPREQALVDAYESATYSVVNIIDVNLGARGGGGLDVETPEGNGSGVMWDGDGNVVTNYHVLASSMAKFNVEKDPAGARGKRVALVTFLTGGGERITVDGTLVGADKARDLAVIKVAAPPELVRPIPQGDSTAVRIGQQVLSIGNPFGAFDHTLTLGIVSALNRDIRAVTGSIIPGGIQTDAAINPGNSGGPLLSSSGKLIGINTAIFTNTGSSVGIAFAIPSDTVRGVVGQLIAGGRAQRASLGAQVATDSVAAKLGVRGGALLQTVAPGGAAAAAGLLATRRGLGGVIPGDTILAVNGRAIPNGAALLGALERYSAGETVTLRIARAGDSGGRDELDVQVTLLPE